MLATNRATIHVDAAADLTALSPDELAAHVHDLLTAHGANPATSPDTTTAARYGAALILAAYGVRPPDDTDDWAGITEAARHSLISSCAAPSRPVDVAELLDTASREALAIVDDTTPPHSQPTDQWHATVRRLTARGIATRRLHLIAHPPATGHPLVVPSALERDAAAGEDIRIGHLSDHPEYRIGLWIVDRILLLPLDGSGILALAGADALRWIDRFDAATPLASLTLDGAR